MVELPRRLVVPEAPALAAVHAYARALVCAQDHPLRVVGGDPEHVIVLAARRALERLEGLPAVVRAVGRGLHHVDDFRVLRVNEHAAEIPAAHDARVARRLPPTLPGVVGAEETLVHDGVDASVARRGHDADPSARLLRQPRAAEGVPRLALVVGLENLRLGLSFVRAETDGPGGGV